ncbi:MAG: ABC transporter ATP-binding protein, partial [Planctomycetota bacterium]
PNGAGKSTLIKIMLGLLKATQGNGRILDFDIERQARQVRSIVGYMPEDDCFLFGMTGVEAVQMSAQLSGLPEIEGLRRAHEIMDFCGVQQERYRKVETYSTGMRQKLRFAQAIVHDPRVLILDEPTSGLDPEERDVMLRRIERLARDHGKTVLICTHILPDVQAVSDAVVILAKGRVRLCDRLESLSLPTEPSVKLRTVGNTDDFSRRLEASGLQIETHTNGTMTVSGTGVNLTAHVWEAAHVTGVAIRSLTPSQISIEDIFLQAVQEPKHGSE